MEAKVEKPAVPIEARIIAKVTNVGEASREGKPGIKGDIAVEMGANSREEMFLMLIGIMRSVQKAGVEQDDPWLEAFSGFVVYKLAEELGGREGNTEIKNVTETTH